MRELEVLKKASDYFRKNISITRKKSPSNLLWTFKTLNKSRLIISFYGKLSTDKIRLKREWSFLYYNDNLYHEAGNRIDVLKQCYKESFKSENAEIELIEA